MFKLEKMDPIPQEDMERLKGEDDFINPFEYDLFNMGRQFSKNIYYMTRYFSDDEFVSGYFVNIKTGERQRLVEE